MISSDWHSQPAVARLENIDDFRLGIEAARCRSGPAFVERLADDVGRRPRRAAADTNGLGSLKPSDDARTNGPTRTRGNQEAGRMHWEEFPIDMPVSVGGGYICSFTGRTQAMPVP